MITELEPTGDGRDDGDGGRPAPDVVAGRGGSRLPAAPLWLWGAPAGAVAASAVWGVLLAAGIGPYHADRPDLHGYRIDGSPCAGGTFAALAKAVKATGSESTPASLVHGTAVDRARCTYSATTSPAVGWTTAYTLDVSVDLHKLSDIRGEFEQERSFDTSTLTVADSSVPVPGLGDEAYALTFTGQAQELKVRRGGAVATIRLTDNTFWSGSGYGPGPDGITASTTALPDTPALPAFRPALIAAARKLLTGLQH